MMDTRHPVAKLTPKPCGTTDNFATPPPAAPPLDAEIARDTARRTPLATIDARLAGFRERRAGGEDTDQLLCDWAAIRAARVALDARPADPPLPPSCDTVAAGDD